MARSGDIDTDINKLLWNVGWNGKETFGGLLVIFLIGVFSNLPSWIGTLAFLAAFVVPPAGIYYVRSNWKLVRDDGLEDTQKAATEIVQLQSEGIEQFNLFNHSSYGSILPPKEYYVTTLLVEDSLLVAHSDATIHLPQLSWKVGESTTEYYYDQVTNISYEPGGDDETGEFWINLSGGHGDKYKSTRKPDSALSEIQRRLRHFKREQ